MLFILKFSGPDIGSQHKDVISCSTVLLLPTGSTFHVGSFPPLGSITRIFYLRYYSFTNNWRDL